MAGGRGDRGLYDGRNVSGVRMWLEVGETEDSMVDALYVQVYRQKVNAVRACVGVVRWLYSSHYSMVGVVRCGNQCKQ